MSRYIGVEMSDHLSKLFNPAPKAKDAAAKRKRRRKMARVSRRGNR